MPQNASQNYYYPDGTRGITDQTIESEAYNTFLDDLVVNDLNWPRPIHRGGTGATSANSALVNLTGEKATQVVANFDAHIWLPGSFYCTNATGQGAPVDGHAFAGICYINEPLADPPTNANLVVEARDQNDSLVTGRLYVREKKAGVWSAWIEQVGGSVQAVEAFDIRYVNVTGDDMSGSLNITSGNFSVAGNGGVGSALTVNGFSTLNGGMSTPLDIYASGSVTCTGATVYTLSCTTTAGIGGALIVNGLSSLNGGITTPSNIYASGSITGTNVDASGGMLSGSNLNVAGVVNVGGRINNNGLIVSQGGIETPAHMYASGNMTCTNFFCASPGNHWTTSSGGSLTVGWAGYQPGGGYWGDSSDARIKTVQGDYTHGLAEIKQLMPRRYIFNGNDLMLGTGGVADLKNPKVSDPGVSSHGAVLNKEFVGLVAQECETIMPEMVTLTPGVIDGVLVDDMRILNASALTYALVNAVKELAARVEQLEAAG